MFMMIPMISTIPTIPAIDWLDAFVGLGIGIVLGGAVMAVLMVVRRHQAQTLLSNAQTRHELLEEQLKRYVGEIEQVRRDLEETNERREEAERTIAKLGEQLSAARAKFDEQVKAQDELKVAFRAVGAEALAANNQQFIELAKRTFETLMTEAKGDVEKKQQAIDTLLTPIRELLEKHHSALGEIEQKRQVAYRGLEEQIKQIAASHDKLGAETNRLVTALRRPEQRGRWGEMQLRNVVELAGMTLHCDFETQPTVRDENDGVQRPDMIVHLPGGGEIIVDAKVAIDAYLDALQPTDDCTPLLERHAKQVQAHCKKLASKRYWEQFERTPKLVVMFMPLESALTAALDVRPELHGEAMKDHVLIATPTLLVALLRAIAYGWQQDDIAANAREISKAGDELYGRLARFVQYFEEIGGDLEKARKTYNQALGSLERRVLPSVRRLKELHATTDAEVLAPPPVEIETRRITSPELRAVRDGGEPLFEDD